MSSRQSPPTAQPPPTIRPQRARESQTPARPSSPPSIDREGIGVELQLAIGKDGLGLELGRTAQIGCVAITELVVSLPGVRFPLDVSGGVSRFRHRRGELRRLTAEVGARALERWAATKLRGLVSAQTPDVWIAVHREGATVGIAARDAEHARILAFDLTIDPHEEDLRFSVVRARGSGLTAPATALAIQATKAVLGKIAAREGARFTIPSAVGRLARALLPEAGARAPAVDNVRWVATAAQGDTWILHASQGLAAEPGDDASRAREANALTREADDARIAGDLDRARTLDVAALERAPRHPEVAARIAEIDQLAGGRAEAALATLTEADREPRASSGLLAGELLAEIGDTSAAIATFVRAAEAEPVPALAARGYERAAELVDDPLDALVWLDRAVARAPSVPRVRWARVARRLAAGRLEDALADVEHLEAIAAGARAKHAVWRRAGEAWRAARMSAAASILFERALRYLPDDPDALAGLGAALVDEATIGPPGLVSSVDKRAARGVALLTRAVDIAERLGREPSAMTVPLARALAEALGDRPAAIARVRAVPSDAPEALDARALEGRWRAALGDTAGASLAFARLRDLAAARAPDDRSDAAERAVAFLLEAADFERTVRGDLLAAQRLLSVALRLRPRAAEVERAYRDVCGMIAPLPPAPAPIARQTHAPVAAIPAPRAAAPIASEPPFAFSTEPPGDADDPRLELRVDELTRILQADPSRDDVVDELAALLIRLGRGLELLALLSARLEEAPPARRAQLLPAQRAVLERLEQDARANGRPGEADLFRDARQMLDE